jgi:hypothetical protein
MANRVTGIFATRSEAEEAVRRLRDAGFESAALRTPGDAVHGPGASSLVGTVAAGTALGGVIGIVLGFLAANRFVDVTGHVSSYPTPRILPIAIVTLLVAALGGLVASWLFSAFAVGDSAYEEQELESGRFEVVVEAASALEEAAVALGTAGALDIVSTRPLIAGG